MMPLDISKENSYDNPLMLARMLLPAMNWLSSMPKYTKRSMAAETAPAPLPNLW